MWRRRAAAGDRRAHVVSQSTEPAVPRAPKRGNTMTVSSTTTLPRRHLGASGLTVSCIGLGCMGMSRSYGETDEAESFASLHRYLELGGNFLDTAEVYGPYDNELLLGRFCATGRASASSSRRSSDGASKPDGRSISGVDSSAEPTSGRGATRVAAAAGTSTRSICSISIASIPEVPAKTARHDGGARAAGKGAAPRPLGSVRQTLRRAHTVHPIAALQSEYSICGAGTSKRWYPRDLPGARHRSRPLQSPRPPLSLTGVIQKRVRGVAGG